MPHSRKRHVLTSVLKKLSFSPIVALQGARQTGKSFIGQHLIPKSIETARYITLDDKMLRVAAQDAPDDFLARYARALPLIIDEAQKSPDLFDALKLSVDQKRIPGKFLLLGSTEFSKLTRIRESLTGRMSRIRIFPFNLAESLSLQPNPCKAIHLLNSQPRVDRESLHLFLERGGLPGLFATRSLLEREQGLADLLDLILYRDARYVKSFEPELGKDILQQLAVLETPNIAGVAAHLRVDTRRIKRHMEVLQELFVVNPLHPHRLGNGKSLYFLYDCALVRHLGGNQRRLLQTWFLNEQLSQRTNQGQMKWRVEYYSTPKGSTIDFLIEVQTGEPKNASVQICAVKILEESRVRKTDTLLLRKFREKMPSSVPVSLVVLGPGLTSYEEDGIEYFPFESMA